MIEVTEEMLKVARSMQSFEPMIQRIIELHEQSKWVKFDVNDVSTYPIVPDGWVNVEVNVFDTINNCVNHDYFCPDYGFNHYQHHVTHWQYLPEFKE